MKKLLIIILIVLLAILAVFTTVKGLKIGNVQILGLKQIKEENENLDKKLEEATKLASTEYDKAISDLEQNAKLLETKKNDYEDMVTYSTESEVQTASQFLKYELEFLWTQIGNHAKKEGEVIKIDVVTGTTNTENVYNLKFTVNGTYVGIAEFISGIENDTNLGFKIEEFSMKPGSSENDLQATFICKDIYIKDISTTNSTTNNFGNEITENTQTEENTNTANTITNTTSTNTAKEE